MLRTPVHKQRLLRLSLLALTGLVGVALLLWALGVFSSARPWVSLFTKPDQAYWTAARTCRKVFPNSNDQRRCLQLAADPNSSTLLAGSTPSFGTAAKQGMYELVGYTPGRGGTGSWNMNVGNEVRWNYKWGLWGGSELSHWWQSALVLRTVVRYLEHTGSASPIYQTVLERSYRIEVHHPIAIASDYFVNMFGDDTAWWGLGWLEAANYELKYMHNTSDAKTFLWTAEYDAHYMMRLKKSCGGFVWEVGYPTNTVTNGEFISLAAELYAFRNAPGPFHDSVKAQQWLRAARSDLNWLEHSRLINMQTGRVTDHLTHQCKLAGGPLTYTEAQTAEALVQMGNALHQPSYYRQAEPFLRFVTTRRLSNMDTPRGDSPGAVREREIHVPSEVSAPLQPGRHPGRELSRSAGLQGDRRAGARRLRLGHWQPALQGVSPPAGDGDRQQRHHRRQGPSWQLQLADDLPVHLLLGLAVEPDPAHEGDRRDADERARGADRGSAAWFGRPGAALAQLSSICSRRRSRVAASTVRTSPGSKRSTSAARKPSITRRLATGSGRPWERR